MELFLIDDDFVKNVQYELRPAAIEKAVDTAHIFVEAIELAPTMVPKLLSVAWKMSSSLQYVLTDWKAAILSPIYKGKGDPFCPERYRLIPVFLHLPKVIDAAFALRINETNKLYSIQLEIQLRVRTETAILRLVDYGTSVKTTAISDLISARDSVPQDLLLAEIRKKNPTSLNKLVTLTLQSIKVIIKNNMSARKAKVERNVPQRSSLSPTLFNLYMEVYGEMIE